MMKTNLPPQAYTREVFANAYEWVQTQSQAIKELAQTPDDLVALYLQARRHGHLGETPYTSKTFSKDLKNLAEGLKQFEEGQTGPSTASASMRKRVTETSQHSSSFTSSTPSHQAQFRSQEVIENREEIRAETQINSISSSGLHKNFDEGTSPMTYSQNRIEQKNQSPHNVPPREERREGIERNKDDEILQYLDPRSREILDAAKIQLNLSKNEEALRMLLVLGSQRLKEILPKI